MIYLSAKYLIAFLDFYHMKSFEVEWIDGANVSFTFWEKISQFF